MKRKPKQTPQLADLRHEAEARRNQIQIAADVPRTEADTLRLVHELQVHQIELEIQNEELQRARAEVEAGLEHFTNLYDFAPLGYFTLTRDGKVRQVNLHGAQLLQIERAKIVGAQFAHFIREDNRSFFSTFLLKVFGSQEKETCELELLKEGVIPRWIQVEAIASNNAEEFHLGILDISARKQAESELQHLSMHDMLTGLYNRAYFYETMKRLELGRHFPVTIIMADVDHLKDINDKFGHAAGDALLIRAARVLVAAFRVEDIVARIGGDEFAVLLPETNAAEAASILKRFDRILEENNRIFVDQPLHVTFGQYTADKNIPLEQPLKEADADLYRQKRNRGFPNEEEDPTRMRRAAALRHQAEDLHALKFDQTPKPRTEVDLIRLVHELEVHEIELDIQNEEMQKSRAEVEATLELFTDLYDFAPVGYFSLGTDGKIFQANLNGARLLGVDRLHLVGRRFGLFVREEDRMVFSTFLESIFARQTKMSREFALQKEDRETIWVQMEATAVGDGLVCRAVVLDINTRKKAEEKLRLAQVELERLLKFSNRARNDLINVVKEKRQAEEQIRQLNSELEQRVRERTIELSTAVESLRQSEATIQTLFRIGNQLNATLNLETILDVLAHEAIQIVNGESGFAGLRTAAGMSIRKYIHMGETIPYEYTWPMGEGIPGWVLMYKIPYGTSDAANDPVMKRDLPINAHVRSVICTPILDSAGEVLGYFDIRNKLDGEGFTIEDQNMLVALAPVASVAIQNALAYQQRLLAEEELRLSFESIRALAARLEAVREEERTDIARELHDQLGQALTAMKFDLAWMTGQLGELDPALVQKSAAVTKQMDTMIKTVRRIATELRPGMLDDLGLAASIEWQARDFEKRTGIACSVSVPAENLSLTRAQSVAMFRILQESLTNVSRHANAKNIQIILSASADVLTLQIHDDGRGIQADEIVGLHSLGLLGMKERAIRLGGVFDIHGLPMDGTLVIVSFPIQDM